LKKVFGTLFSWEKWRKKMKLSALLLFFCAALLFFGCSTTPSVDDLDNTYGERLVVSKDEAKKEWQKFEKKLFPVPTDAIGLVRDYVEDNLDGLTDDESDKINKNQPEIKYNEMKMEYCFYWRIDGKLIIEVICTPPPCQPFAVYRVKRLYFP
jgi:hypothetical protein